MINNELSEIECNIYKLAKTNKNAECLYECMNFMEKLNKENIEDKRLMWYLYYHKALMEYRLNKIKLALESAKASLNYVNEIELNKEASLSMLMLATCYEYLNNINEAKKIYRTLSKYYKKTGCVNLRMTCVFNIACINNDLGKINKIIAMAEYMMYIPDSDTDLDKSTLLKQMQLSVERLVIH